MKITPLLPILASFVFVTACSLFSHKNPQETSAPSAVEEKPADHQIEVDKTLPTPVQEEEATWSYEGETGPEHWGDLKPEYVLCKEGKEQSPVDLIYKRPLTDRPIEIHYVPSDAKIVNNGHTVQVNFAPGNTIEMDGVTYELNQAQFHTASEHTISGNRLPMELQLFHTSEDGKVAVLSVILIDGPAHPIVESLWQNMPIQKEVEKELDFKINPSNLIPKTRTYYHYMGSLTTPPCTEGVSWNVFNTPVTLSQEQIKSFRQLYPANSRPIQPLNDRPVANYK